MTEKRTCKICKTEFFPKTRNHIYCSDCGGNPKQAYVINIRRQKEYRDILGETKDTLRYTCLQCGRTGYSKFPREFCSDDCRHAYLDAHLFCETCGRNLAELDIHFDKRTGHPVFCSDECRDKYRWKVAREKGLVDNCPCCGKEFITKIKSTHNGYYQERSKFCSLVCYRNYRVTRKE